MFTGIVEALGVVRAVQERPVGRLVRIACQEIADDLNVGASVAVNGVCLTVIDRHGPMFSCDVGPETLARTDLGSLRVGDRVNLERAVRVGSPLGGHWVLGHVDTTAVIVSRRVEDDWHFVRFQCAEEWTRYMVPKGSVAVDGVSLTIVEVLADGFTVALIPHTLAVTTLGSKSVGDTVNLEVDILAKYVVRWLTSQDWHQWVRSRAAGPQ
ncbi:MAG: riboflavin synthase [Gemmataceae bacterium]